MSRIAIPSEAREIPFEAFARAESPTAANATKRLYSKSGAINYRVVLGLSGGGMTNTVVNAETGDDAAEGALRKFPGYKVINVTPAGDEFRSVDDFAASEAA